MNLLHALNKILQANRKLNEKKNEEEKLKMDNKNREKKEQNLIDYII